MKIQSHVDQLLATAAIPGVWKVPGAAHLFLQLELNAVFSWIHRFYQHVARNSTTMENE